MMNGKPIMILLSAVWAEFASARLRKKGRMGHGGMGQGGMGYGGGGGHGGTGKGGHWGYGYGGMAYNGGMEEASMEMMDKGQMMDLIHALLDNHDRITREYHDTSDGIEAYTYSDDLQVASWIQTHVYQMMSLMASDDEGIRLGDDLFRVMFDLRDYHTMDVTNTTEGSYGGVRVVQKVASDDVVPDDEARECTKLLIQAHAEVLSRFIDNGRMEMRLDHPAPEECDAI